jgi:hypothetical protein
MIKKKKKKKEAGVRQRQLAHTGQTSFRPGTPPASLAPPTQHLTPQEGLWDMCMAGLDPEAVSKEQSPLGLDYYGLLSTTFLPMGPLTSDTTASAEVLDETSHSYGSSQILRGAELEISLPLQHESPRVEPEFVHTFREPGTTSKPRRAEVSNSGMHLDPQHTAFTRESACEGLTALHLAAMRGHCDVVKYLICNGACPDLPDKNGWTPLHVAADYGHERVVEVLIQCGADADCRIRRHP